MALKEYVYNGSTYLFDEDNPPKGAVEVQQTKAKTPPNKQAQKPKNK